MVTLAEAQANRKMYGCVRCGHSLTRAQAYTSSSEQHVGGPSYFCEQDAPADARPVADPIPQQRIR